MRIVSKFKSLVKLVIITLICIMMLSSTVFAEPYKSYTYDYWLDPVPTPHAYLPESSVYGKDIGLTEFKNASDIFVDKDNIIYVADTGNNRIVCMNSSFSLIRVITTFKNNGKDDTFNEPRGVFVSDDGYIYVADTKNQRVVKLDKFGKFLKEYGKPDTDLISKTQEYNPIKLVVDRANRIYIIASGINKGLIELDPEGKFRGFVGANEVDVNPVEYIWKLMSTKEQKSRMELFVPTEYANISLDKEGFLYVTTSTIDIKTLMNDADPIRRLNPKGVDVLRRYGYGSPVGDYVIKEEDGVSKLVDIAVDDEAGIYSVLDENRGRIFTYDYDGNLLYVFGGTGYQEGNFDLPTSIEFLGDKILVLDGARNCVNVFYTSDYGKSVRDAIKLHYEGKYEEAAKEWQKVLDFNANSDLAYIGLGRILLRDKNYQEAMKHFKLANNRIYYSKAFKLYRKQIIQENFGYIASGVIAAMAVLIVIFKIKRKGKYIDDGEGVDI